MKNAIYIDIDTERKDQEILIGKPPEITPPATAEEAAVMVKNDVTCITDALLRIIDIGDQNGYFKKEDVIPASIKRLEELLAKPPVEPTTEGQ